MPLLEIACFTPSSALLAASAGADRIELCANQHLGGTTPPSSWLPQIKATVQKVPIFIMIRPRGGDFFYSNVEFEEMKAQIRGFETLGADGFVFGMLKEDGCSVDVERTAELVRLASPKPCTFHRAFDEVADLMTGLEDVVSTGCRSILSSGGRASAEEGVEGLGELVKKADGRVTIIAGGGVRSGNIGSIRKVSGVRYLHSSAIVGGDSDSANVEEVKKMKSLL
ncbi:copper homeostasis protein cutC [Zymoseptoria brevis]|uniref:Copper homeostasis protein cutC homolog n=1 Tax=Zymoseptoria brevis TaxID=1047168 RepID=A0A0F4GJR7_9PEZI|nr:copper homeostasis protein cutC [Zymoseptoria brevis]